MPLRRRNEQLGCHSSARPLGRTTHRAVAGRTSRDLPGSSRFRCSSGGLQLIGFVVLGEYPGLKYIDAKGDISTSRQRAVSILIMSEEAKSERPQAVAIGWRCMNLSTASQASASLASRGDVPHGSQRRPYECRQRDAQSPWCRGGTGHRCIGHPKHRDRPVIRRSTENGAAIWRRTWRARTDWSV